MWILEDETKLHPNNGRIKESRCTERSVGMNLGTQRSRKYQIKHARTRSVTYHSLRASCVSK